MLRESLLTLLLVAALAGPAAAQIPDIGGTVGGVVGAAGDTVNGVGHATSGPLGTLQDTPRDIGRTTVEELRDARRATLDALRHNYPDQIDRDGSGNAVIRNEVIAIAPTPEALAAATVAGFSVSETNESPELGLTIVVLEAPPRMSTRRAIAALRRLDPNGAYDFNHLYSGAGGARSAAKQAVSRAGPRTDTRVGLIDSGVAQDHPAFGGVHLEQRGFGGAARAGDHGTAVASLLVGRDGGFRGAAPGAELYVADVYGGRPTGGGASEIVAAIAWLVQQRAAVINISLVGPPNRALEAAVSAAIARGYVVVAAVGNDGPAAPPLYPAAYTGVVGVTGVDGANRVLPEAGRGAHVDFAAPGSDFAAAAMEGGYASIRGTSYAAPIVAGLLAAHLRAPDSAAAARAQTELSQTAEDLGARGADRVFGAGLVGREIRGADQVARR